MTPRLHGRAIRIVTGIELAAEEQDSHYFPLGQTAPLISEHAGLFVSHVAVGVWLQAGDLIGHVYDAFLGERRAEIRAPVAGLLSGIRRQPLLYEGDLIARLQTRARVDVPASAVRGQEQ